MKKTAPLGALALLTASLAAIYGLNSDDPQQDLEQALAPPTPQQKSASPKTEQTTPSEGSALLAQQSKTITPQPANAEKQQTALQAASDEENVAGDLPRETHTRAWNELPEVPAQFEELLKDGTERHFVEYSNFKVQDLRVGDQLDIPVPQLDQSFVTEVVSVVPLEHGGKDITSRFDTGNGENYRVTLTSGQGALYATIDTPYETYFVQGHDGEAWVISSREMSSLRSWEHSDELLPEPVKAPKPPVN
ncbi:hypothetical protein F9L16_03400 [Agarivorans sp. B2Z047]|uniref:hypothetical protein n=1 Tax=Agarivorans sp. B2Z047 TaxID=2652721 RepID=UPI00128BE4AE|nr:hypothetical protein [Agarivorans sp. B2Z047]MPW28041.1 hypothetical protein [Agarivorans sp. B2Z047]UQN44127.1 hypothetical protein LQZ07_06535 [Agarivorans sp. B2Z047]